MKKFKFGELILKHNCIETNKMYSIYEILVVRPSHCFGVRVHVDYENLQQCIVILDVIVLNLVLIYINIVVHMK